jgi:2,4-dienoyl-CoA reductase-like NADH-dependent reductase (Old Yellow Enzyme family)/thioredoxin reductase
MFELRNEFIFAPVKLGYSDKTGIVTDRHLDFYQQRSKHAGAVIPEPLYMDMGLRELPTQMGIDKDEKIENFKKLSDLIHSNGAKAVAHLNHPGRLANPKIPGNYWWSSTDKPCENGGATPERMDREKMDKVIELITTSAQRAVKAGFDMIEIQFGHGYLMAQFLSPMVNDRDDEYGGSLKNRMRFPLEVARAVREAVDVPLIARVTGDEIVPAGFHVDEMIVFAKELQKAGFDALHITAGSGCTTPPWFFQHMFVPKGKTWELAGRIKENVDIPVIFLGKINSAKDISLLKEKYGAEYFAVGRALVADPDFVGKQLGIVKGVVRPCLACSEGCLGGVKAGKGLGCMVNPRVNTGLPEVTPAGETKLYAVIGGGLAGMQAAITLRDRGHDVNLYEKNELGGQFNLAWLPPNKQSLKELVDYYIEELKVHSEHQVNVIKKEATAEEIEKGGYDGVIIATGAVPAVPPIKGLKKYYWTEFLEDEHLPKDKKVVVIGGGLIGLEVASKLVDGGNHVVIVEMLDEIARGMEMIEKALTVKKLKEKGAEIFVNHTVVEVDDDKVMIESKEGTKTIEGVDDIVVATGMKPYVPFELNVDVPVYKVGDAEKVAKATDAIHDAYKLALEL